MFIVDTTNCECYRYNQFFFLICPKLNFFEFFFINSHFQCNAYTNLMGNKMVGVKFLMIHSQQDRKTLWKECMSFVKSALFQNNNKQTNEYAHGNVIT